MEKHDLGRTSLGMDANLAALLSYLFWFISGFIIYVLEKENKFVRFHAMQSILSFGFLFGFGVIVSFIPFIGVLMVPVCWVISTMLWIILMFKAYNGEYFKLPVIGDIAQKNAS
ncbi:MAG: DUF4870 domain-containing protein [Candidatus Omnitrophota bacterium]